MKKKVKYSKDLQTECYGTDLRSFKKTYPVLVVNSENPKNNGIHFVSKKEMEGLQERIFDDLRAVRESGQKEYAHDDSNCHDNFDRVSKRVDGVLDPSARVLMTYFEKHIDGIYAHLKGNTSQREPVQGRIKDAIMYLILLQGLIERR